MKWSSFRKFTSTLDKRIGDNNSATFPLMLIPTSVFRYQCQIFSVKAAFKAAKSLTFIHSPLPFHGHLISINPTACQLYKLLESKKKSLPSDLVQQRMTETLQKDPHSEKHGVWGRFESRGGYGAPRGPVQTQSQTLFTHSTPQCSQTLSYYSCCFMSAAGLRRETEQTSQTPR